MLFFHGAQNQKGNHIFFLKFLRQTHTPMEYILCMDKFGPSTSTEPQKNSTMFVFFLKIICFTFIKHEFITI